MTRVAVLDDYQDVARTYGPWDRLGSCIDLTVLTAHIDSVDALAAALAPFEVVVAMRERTPFPRQLLERLPRLRLLVTTGSRNASIDVEAADDLDVVVSGTGFSAASTVELAWAHLLALPRNVAAEDASMRRGGWQERVGPELSGRTLGLLGFGNVGSRMAEIAQLFGLRVIAWSQNLTAARAARHGAVLVPKDELFAQADFLSIHYRLSDRSAGIVGRSELARMKRTAYLINTSRGPLVDEAALISALRNREIAGAGLDVFDTEPLPEDHPLRSTENTLLTPHIGYVATTQYARWFEDIVENIEAWLEGRSLRVIAAQP